jgi:hypothetical protein
MRDKAAPRCSGAVGHEPFQLVDKAEPARESPYRPVFALELTFHG